LAGLVDYRDLPRCLNPDVGLIVTANDDLNHWGVAKPINVCMGSYRSDRIAQLLAGGEKLTAVDNFKIHYDVYSLQAERFMQILKPLLPDTPQGKFCAIGIADMIPNPMALFI
jgi:penicillin amidase